MPARKRGAGPAFTVEFPRPLEARRDGDAWWFQAGERELRLSNLNKAYWPDDGFTKGDLVAYYLNVAELILPHLSGRPLTMKRMPDGVGGEFFYEKTAPSHTPEWIRRCQVHSDDAKGGMIDYLMVEDLAGLLYVANLGCIEFHPLHSRCADVAHPDYLFFDLDPFPPYTYEDVLDGGAAHQGAARSAGADGLPEDLGRHGAADLHADRARRLLLRAGPRVRRRVRAADPGRRPGAGDHGVEDRRPHRQDLHRPQHEPQRRQHRGRLLAPPRAPRTGLDPTDLG